VLCFRARFSRSNLEGNQYFRVLGRVFRGGLAVQRVPVERARRIEEPVELPGGYIAPVGRYELVYVLRS